MRVLDNFTFLLWLNHKIDTGSKTTQKQFYHHITNVSFWVDIYREPGKYITLKSNNLAELLLIQTKDHKLVNVIHKVRIKSYLNDVFDFEITKEQLFDIIKYIV